jgi:hypothetical protein
MNIPPTNGRDAGRRRTTAVRSALVVGSVAASLAVAGIAPGVDERLCERVEHDGLQRDDELGLGKLELHQLDELRLDPARIGRQRRVAGDVRRVVTCRSSRPFRSTPIPRSGRCGARRRASS